MLSDTRELAQNPLSLPKIFVKFSHGGIYLQWIRCGKKNCRCARGAKHPAYYYFEREDGKTKKTYIRKADLPQAMKMVAEVTYWRDRIRSKKRLFKNVMKAAREEKRIAKAAGIKKELTIGEILKINWDRYEAESAAYQPPPKFK